MLKLHTECWSGKLNKIVSIVLLSICTLNALEFHSFEEALKKQKSSKKTIMIDVVREDCHYCDDMDREVFQDIEMSKWINKRFIAVKIDLDKESLPYGLKTSFTPTFFFIGAEQKLVKKILGSWNINDFKDLTKGIK